MSPSLTDPIRCLLACYRSVQCPVNQRLCYRPIQFNNSMIISTLGNSLALQSSHEIRLPRPPLPIRQRQLQSKMKHILS
jgi:hypothetical protein